MQFVQGLISRLLINQYSDLIHKHIIMFFHWHYRFGLKWMFCFGFGMHIANCLLSLVSILCPIQSFHLLLSQVVLNIEKYYTWKFLKLSHLYDGLLLEVRVCFFAVFFHFTRFQIPRKIHYHQHSSVYGTKTVCVCVCCWNGSSHRSNLHVVGWNCNINHSVYINVSFLRDEGQKNVKFWQTTFSHLNVRYSNCVSAFLIVAINKCKLC